MATKLKMILVQREILQADLAREASISESKLSRIARGRVEPSDEEMRRLADALGVNVSEISEDWSGADNGQ